MFVQKSFQKPLQKSLYLVATPIGNLQELTPRALEILKDAEIIICESFHSYKKLENYFQINGKTKLIITHNSISEKNPYRIEKTLQKMLNYEKIVLISKAGYPLISDPGQILVNKWINLGNSVITISGSSSLLNCLVASGLYYHHFSFLGFLPRGNKKQQNLLQKYRLLSNVLVIFENPFRIVNTLNNIKIIFGDCQVAIGRELTKIYEEFIRGTLEEIIDYLKDKKMKGELTIIIGII